MARTDDLTIGECGLAVVLQNAVHSHEALNFFCTPLSAVRIQKTLSSLTYIKDRCHRFELPPSNLIGTKLKSSEEESYKLLGKRFLQKPCWKHRK